MPEPGAVHPVVVRRTRGLSGSRLARPGRLGDPIAVGLVAFVVYALHGYDGVLDRDLGVFAYGGEHVAHGVPPYVGIFNSVGPLADAVPGLAMWLAHLADTDADAILVARLVFTVLSALCCALLAVLARDTFGSRAAGYVAPAVFLPYECFLHLASDGPREKTTMVLFLLACLVLVGRRRWAWAGVFAALATLTWQPSLFAALAAVAAAALLTPAYDRRRAVTRFVTGGLLPTTLTVAYFVVAGALHRALDGFWVINAGYTSQPSAITSPRTIATLLWSGYHASLPVIVLGLAAFIALAARAVPSARSPRTRPAARRLLVPGAAAVAATIWTLAVVNGSPDLFVVLPFAALGAAGVVDLLLGRVHRRAAVAVATAVVVGAVALAGVESVVTRDDRLISQRADVAAVLGTQPAGATVASIDAPQVLALSGRTDPISYQLFSDTMRRYLKAKYVGGLGGVLAALRRSDPTFVVVGSQFHGTFAQGWLARDYAKVGGGDTWTWYLRRTAGTQALLRARTAHQEVMAAYGRGRG